MTAVQQSFGGGGPAWLTQFEDDPLDAIDRLLMQRAVLDRPSRAEPVELLRDWLVALRDEEDFGTRVDTAVAEWIALHWLETPTRDTDAKRLARAWVGAFELISVFDFFEASARELLKRVGEREPYLWPLSSGPARDPVGRFLLAIADHQRDRSLTRMWWNLCDVPPEVPYYHAQYILAGIRGLPVDEPDQRGGLRQDILHAVIRLAISLSGAVDEGRVQEQTAAEEFTNAAVITVAAFPFPHLWQQGLGSASANLSERVRSWLLGVTPDPLAPRPRARRPSASRSPRESLVGRPSSDWTQVAVDARRLIEQRQPRGRALADGLLADQRRYAERTGDASWLSRSLCNFAHALWHYDPGTARTWANEARLWMPSDPYTWNTLTRALMLGGQLQQSIQVGWRAIERFPENEVAWNDLGAALERGKRFLEAEEVFWQSAERFPERPYGWRGLGDVLRKQGEFTRAEEVYRGAIGRGFAENAFIHDGLANVLKAVGRHDESIEHYKKAIKLDPGSAYSWRGLAMAEKAAGRLDDAQAAFEGGLRHADDDERLIRGLDALRKQRSRLGGAARAEPEEPPAELETAVDPVSASPVELAEAPEEGESQLSAARTLRRAARRRFESTADGKVARRHAARMLDALEATRPWDARPYAEAIIGSAESNDLTAAQAQLSYATRRFPEAPQLAYAETRFRRARGAIERDNTGSRAASEVAAPMRRLRRIDQSARAVELLETLSAQLAWGSDLEEEATLTIAKIRQTVGAHGGSDDGFSGWWKLRVRDYLFGRSNGHSDIHAVRERVRAHQRELDALEEDLTNRMTIVTL
jgi:tetratricopeptide (TPR) repeat protein